MTIPPIFICIDIIISAIVIILFPSLLLGLKPVKTNFDGSNFSRVTLESQENNKIETGTHDLLAEQYKLIEVIMQTSQPFLDQNFSRETMAELSRIPISTITKVIHAKAGVSFNDYVNTYRIDYLYRTLSSNPSWFDYTLEALSYKVGFSNRATFNNSVKKIRGIKPSEMISELKNLYKKE